MGKRVYRSILFFQNRKDSKINDTLIGPKREGWPNEKWKMMSGACHVGKIEIERSGIIEASLECVLNVQKQKLVWHTNF
ncbi:hypothetical protein CEXT_292871 [Caerostris extrusa]|uniref:Uncharacterized protein n=1 Tax=Caerostris extrusa TaxID=172846 RepID=A0AAV4PB07_CAEEX|nr:hypothetical protein CEXT_292871 [Caerostris extrusa]